MRRPPPPTEADMIRLLDRLFERCVTENKLPQLFAAVIDRLSKTDPQTAMVVIKTLVDAAFEQLHPEDRDALLREFATLANTN